MPTNSTTKRRRRKRADRPAKPYSEFPLYAHSSGSWAKKIRGEFHYFGRWGSVREGKMQRVEGDGWRNALALYKAQADDLHAGRTPRIQKDEFTVADLCNRFLIARQRKMNAGELSPRTFAEYRQATDLLIATFGKRRLVDDLAADDFESLRADMADRWGPSRLSKFIQLVRTVFKYAVDNGCIDRPVRLGSGFNKPDKAVMRKHKATSGKKLFTAGEIRMILNALDGKKVTIGRDKTGKPTVVQPKRNLQLRAAVLLGINAGLGNSDVAGLQFSHFDLKAGWLDYPRIKTGLPRRVPLWSQTIAALKAANSQRRQPKLLADAECVFLNRAGRRMVHMTEKSHQDYVSSQFRSVLRLLQINGRKGLSFYALRHTFATVALQTGDRDACRALMGHGAHDMLAAYDETGPSDARLQAVTEHVRTWLFDAEAGK